MNILLMIFVFGTTYGKIQGVVKDETSGNPLPYVSITVVGAELGASTDENGNFFILNVDPGKYVVRVTNVGYQTKLIDNVVVEVGQVVRLKITIAEQPIELTPITVTSEPPPVQKEMIGPTFSIKKEEIFLLPVDYGLGFVSFQPSVVRIDTALHVRGGRASEVLFMIDNVSIVDPQTGDLAIQMSKGILDEVIFLPGSFDVEYGRAMSGVINVITARPADQLRAKVYGKTERMMPYYWDFGYDNYQASVHVPVSRRAKGYLSFDLMQTDDWDPKLFILPHKQRDDYSVYGKWFLRLPGMLRLTVSGAKSLSKFDRYNSQWKFLLNHYRSDLREGDLEAVHLNYLPSPRRTFDLTVSRLATEREYGLRLDQDAAFFERYEFRASDSLVWPFPGLNNPYGVLLKYFYSEGDYPEYEKKTTQVVKGSLSSTMQLHQYHELKTGVEYARIDVDNYTAFAVDNLHRLVDDYQYRPTELAAYLQDNIDYKGMYAKAGVRYDEFRTGMETVTTKRVISPRFGLSYMVTERFIFRTNIGQYTQPPLYDHLYGGLGLVPIPTFLTNPPPIGNPDLEPEKTRSFEMGLQGEVRPNVMITANTFYKDVTDLVGTRIKYALPRNYVTYYNVEAANIKGIEMILDFKGEGFTGKISYTLSYAKGTSSFAEDVYQRYYRENPNPDTAYVPEATDFNLDFDQRHRIFIQGLLDLPLATKMCVFGYLGNGFPYTLPGPEGKLEQRNIYNLPFQKQIDCVFLKGIKFGRFTANANVEVINVLGIQNQIAPRFTYVPENDIQPRLFVNSYSIFNSTYHPAADKNHDGILAASEYYEAFGAINDQSEDYVNCYTQPRRARLGISVEF